MILIEKIAQVYALQRMGHGARLKAVAAFLKRTGKKPKKRTLMESLARAGRTLPQPAT